MEKLYTRSNVIIGGKIIPPDNEIEVSEEDAKSLVKTGAASPEWDEDSKKGNEGSGSEGNDGSGTEGNKIYTLDEFKDLGWDKAREVALDLYEVRAASWDELINEFISAQQIYVDSQQ